MFRDLSQRGVPSCTPQIFHKKQKTPALGQTGLFAVGCVEVLKEEVLSRRDGGWGVG